MRHDGLSPARAVQRGRRKAIRTTTPATSPQNAWGKNAVVQARVRNIAFINDRVANVRFTRIVQTETDTQSSDWIATVTFAYANAPMAEGDRYRNPLGFQVENYRSDPEVIR